MAEEPKKEDKGNQGSDQKDNSWAYLKEFFLANSTVVLNAWCEFGLPTKQVSEG